MKRVADLMHRLGLMLTLAALVALLPQASGAGAFGGSDCPDAVHAADSVERAIAALPAEDCIGGYNGHKTPCKSVCCGAACAVAVLSASAMIDLPAAISGERPRAVNQDGEGIDPKGLSRPPKAGLAA